MLYRWKNFYSQCLKFKGLIFIRFGLKQSKGFCCINLRHVVAYKSYKSKRFCIPDEQRAIRHNDKVVARN